MQRIYDGYTDPVHPKPIDAELYRHYSETLRRAVEMVKMDDTDLQAQWLANVSRFAAYKAANATRLVAEAVAEGDAPAAAALLRRHRQYLAAEAVTARSRTRTGKQWQQFAEPDHVRLFPNIRWLPSRSATPREAHQAFWDKVWPKGDDFWNHNQPGSLWNCKCDWEETDDDATPRDKKKVPDLRPDDPDLPPPDNRPKYIDDLRPAARGLQGNPAKTGQIFTDTPAKRLNPDPNDPDRSHPLFAKAPEGTEKNCKKANRNEMARLGRKLNKDRRITCTIDDVEHEFDFENFKYNTTNKEGKRQSNKIATPHHFAGSMFESDDFWLKNEVLVNPQPYLDRVSQVVKAEIDEHNTGEGTIALKDATDYFFYLKTKLANGHEIYLHAGRYKESGKLYLYYASEHLPKYVENLQ